jgi:hypothetical protein
MIAVGHYTPKAGTVNEHPVAAVRQRQEKPAVKRSFYRPDLPTLYEVLAERRASPSGNPKT